MNRPRPAAQAVLVLLLVACSSDEDRARVAERVAMAEAQAAIIHSSPDCPALTLGLDRWYADNRAAVDASDAWWNGLSEGSQSQLISEFGGRDNAALAERIAGTLECGEVSWFSDRTSTGDPAPPAPGAPPAAPLVAAPPAVAPPAVAPSAPVIP